MLILATLGAPERRRILARKRRNAPPEPEPSPVTTSRATIVSGTPLPGEAEAAAWLRSAGEEQLAADLLVLNRMLYAHRLVSADPHARPVGRRHAIVARVGFGAGERVAEGKWADARELAIAPRRSGRAKALHPQARLAAILSGRESGLVCEELALRARLDVDDGRERSAALQVMIALDAALAELAGEAPVADRMAELRERREPIADAAQAALAGPLTAEQREAVESTLGRIESALRARAAGS